MNSFPAAESAHSGGVRNTLHTDNIMRDAANTPLRLVQFEHPAIEHMGGENRLTLGFFIGWPGDDLGEAVIWS